eukprot:scaffold925_cov129-Cylindrotheca_fusiformis.AAC.39
MPLFVCPPIRLQQPGFGGRVSHGFNRSLLRSEKRLIDIFWHFDTSDEYWAAEVVDHAQKSQRSGTSMVLFRICRGQGGRVTRDHFCLPSAIPGMIIPMSPPTQWKKQLSGTDARTWTEKRNQVPDLIESFESDYNFSEHDFVPHATLKQKDQEEFVKKREMSPLQERLNGVTTLPAGFYCFLFLVSGSWLDVTRFQSAREDLLAENFDGAGCISISWLPNLHALPPLPVIAAALSMILHMPFSFLYHWTYAHRLSPTARLNHWSRRMDQSMLHVYAALLSYSYSGRFDFFALNLMFNIDCIYRQFEATVLPNRNQSRLLIAILAFTLPILKEGDYAYFIRLWGSMFTAFVVFATYPLGGWSHTVFHLMFLTVPPLMMTYVPGLPASQEQLNFAAKCAFWAESKSV